MIYLHTEDLESDLKMSYLLISILIHRLGGRVEVDPQEFVWAKNHLEAQDGSKNESNGTYVFEVSEIK